tara:strand:+ start:620 stop:1216 length:597 start_codon:yes stop_codon:yes gene_type:complete
MKTKKVNIKDLILNPENPRVIKDYKFKKLIKSIKTFPEMLKLRPIVVNEKMEVLGGNMRTRACIEAGLKEVYIQVANLTKEQEKEFIIKDNSSFGEWDWDLLANEWEIQDLKDWGLDIPKWEDKLEFDNDIEDTGDYDYPEDDLENSHVKMVQLFLTTETEPKFKQWELELRSDFDTDNLTDTIYKLVEYYYNEKRND